MAMETPMAFKKFSDNWSKDRTLSSAPLDTSKWDVTMGKHEIKIVYQPTGDSFRSIKSALAWATQNVRRQITPPTAEDVTPRWSIPPSRRVHKNIHIIVKPAQGRKTAEAMEVRTNENNSNAVAFWVVDNYQAQANQLEVRLEDKLKNTGREVITLHCNNAGFGHAPVDYIASLIRRGVSNDIILLNNGTQLPKMKDIIDKINDDKFRSEFARTEKLKFIVFLDESDKTSKTFVDNMADVLSEVNTYFISATHSYNEKLRRKIKRAVGSDKVGIHPNAQDLSSYQPLRSMTHVPVDGGLNRKFIDDIRMMVQKLKKEDNTWKNNPNQCYMFVPSLNDMTTHSATAKLLSEEGIVTMVINSDGYTIYENGKQNGKPEKKMNKNENDDDKTDLAVITRYRQKYANKPFALTGHKCVSRAQTLHTPEMPFTHGVFSCGVYVDCKTDSCEMYQIMARVAHSFGNGHKPAVYYSSSDMMEAVLKREQIAYDLADRGGDEMTLADLDNSRSTNVDNAEGRNKRRKVN